MTWHGYPLDEADWMLENNLKYPCNSRHILDKIDWWRIQVALQNEETSVCFMYVMVLDLGRIILKEECLLHMFGV